MYLHLFETSDLPAQLFNGWVPVQMVDSLSSLCLSKSEIILEMFIGDLWYGIVSQTVLNSSKMKSSCSKLFM